MQQLLEKQEKFAALTTMMAGITVQQLDAAQAACVQNPAGGAPPLVRKPEAIGMTCGGVAGAQNLGVPLAGLTAAGDVILYPAVVTRNAAGMWECTQPYTDLYEVDKAAIALKKVAFPSHLSRGPFQQLQAFMVVREKNPQTRP